TTLLVAFATLLPPPPIFVTNATSKVVAVGAATSLAVLAQTYSGVTNFQWQLSSTNIPAATTNPYNFTVTSTKYGSYRVTVTDGWNPATNSTPAVTITPPAPSIVLQPANRASVVGGSPTFNVLAATQSGITN